MLQARDLTKRFGGLTAVSGVSLQVATGEIHAVIGPNGAGKSTLMNLLSGDLVPTDGVVRIGEREITSSSPHRRSQQGIGRSYQKTNIFDSLTALENCRLASQSRTPRAWRFWARTARQRDVIEGALGALSRVGLQHRADNIAGALSHGEQRQLEIAVALATEPQVLLLDEPLAGTGSLEADSLIQLLRELRHDHAILLVEHDMDAVFALANQLTVMVDGLVLRSGVPETVREDPEVEKAYLGEEEEAQA